MPSESLLNRSSQPLPTMLKGSDERPSHFRLGLFGDTRSGKTMYLTSVYDSADRGMLPKQINLKPQPGSSLAHLHSRLAMIRAGQWPPGDLDTELVALVVDYGHKKYGLQTRDFKGGDFGDFTEPKSRAEFERFVNGLFKGCSAYVFLVDPGVLKQTREPGDSPAERRNREHEALRVKGGIQAALELAGCTGWTSNLFHRPIAIVFTKCDLHPDVSADPSSFAAKYLDSTCRHLKSHAPRRHKYFAVSSTGPVAQVADGKSVPPLPLRPENLLAPLIWCIDKHRERNRWLMRSVTAVLLLLLVACCLAAYLHNTNLLSRIRSQILTAEDERLVELFREADRLPHSSFTMWLTHWNEPERIRQAVAAEAYHRFKEAYDKRVDANDVVRDTAIYHELDAKGEEFRRSYPGTAESEDVRVLLRNQRDQLGTKIVQELEELAAQGKEGAFDEKQKQYVQVATPELDSRVGKARETLSGRLLRRKVSVILDKRLSRPRDLEAIRREISGVEDEVMSRGRPETEPQVKYVRAMRGLYDSLQTQGWQRPLHLSIQATSDFPWRWSLHLMSAKDKDEVEIGRGDWMPPGTDPNNAGYFLVTSPKIAVDLLAAGTLLFRLDEDTWGGNGSLSLEFPIRTLPFGSPQQIDTNEGTTFWITFFDDGEISKYFSALSEIEKLENEVFRSKPTQ